jgi:hypothetical protein
VSVDTDVKTLYVGEEEGEANEGRRIDTMMMTTEGGRREGIAMTRADR